MSLLYKKLKFVDVVTLFLCIAAAQNVVTEDIKYLTADDVPTCQQSNADLDDCVKRIFDNMLLRLKDGIKELNIPALDPFALNRTTFKYENGPISGRITMKKALVSGFSKTIIKSVDLKSDSDKIKLRTVSFVPKLEIVGQYSANVTFNAANLRPKGTFNVTMMDITIETKSEGVFYEKDGHRFIRLTKFDAEPTIGGFKFDANGIFPDPTLNELVINMTNQYWREIFRIMLPETRQYWAPMFKRAFNEVLTVVPYDNFVKAN